MAQSYCISGETGANKDERVERGWATGAGSGTP